MAYNLKTAKVHAIIGLLDQGWSQRRISRELGVNRETVARYDRIRRGLVASPAISTAGSDASLLRELLISVPERAQGRTSECGPFREVILKKLEFDLTAQRIYQDLVGDHTFTGSYSSLGYGGRPEVMSLDHIGTKIFCRIRSDHIVNEPGTASDEITPSQFTMRRSDGHRQS